MREREAGARRRHRAEHACALRRRARAPRSPRARAERACRATTSCASGPSALYARDRAAARQTAAPRHGSARDRCARRALLLALALALAGCTRIHTAGSASARNPWTQFPAAAAGAHRRTRLAQPALREQRPRPTIANLLSAFRSPLRSTGQLRARDGATRADAGERRDQPRRQDASSLHLRHGVRLGRRRAARRARLAFHLARRDEPAQRREDCATAGTTSLAIDPPDRRTRSSSACASPSVADPRHLRHRRRRLSAAAGAPARRTARPQRRRRSTNIRSRAARTCSPRGTTARRSSSLPNPRYWRGTPAIAQLTYRIIPDADTLFNELQTHEIDVDASVTESQIARLHARRHRGRRSGTSRTGGTWRSMPAGRSSPTCACGGRSPRPSTGTA